jgi:hypothetical protein
VHRRTHPETAYPGQLEQLGPLEHASGVASKRSQQVQFTWLEVEDAAALAHVQLGRDETLPNVECVGGGLGFGHVGAGHHHLHVDALAHHRVLLGRYHRFRVGGHHHHVRFFVRLEIVTDHHRVRRRNGRAGG